MKHLFTILFILTLLSTGYGQIVNIPDEYLKLELVNAVDFFPQAIAKNLEGDWTIIDLNGDGEIQESEASQISYLQINNTAMSDATGIDSFLNLTTISFNSNDYITSLNFSNLNNLNSILCTDNDILESLDVSGLNNLTTLRCTNNSLTSIDLTNSLNLEQLHCQGNNLTSLDISQLSNLQELECQHNSLTNLNLNNLSSLNFVDCNYNELNTLNINELTSLEELKCSFNNISELNISDSNLLVYLSAGYNQLNSIDLFANSLITRLTLSHNNLTTIDVSNLPNLEYFDVRSNYNLTSVFIKNGTIDSPILTNCDSLEYICSDESEISNIQQYLNGYDILGVTVNSYCSFTPGGEFYEIQGTAKIDLNNDGCSSTTSSIEFPMEYNITNYEIYGTFFGRPNGNYNIPVQQGIHEITPIAGNTEYFSVLPTSFTINFPTDENPFTQDICVQANGEFNDLDIYIAPMEQARPGFETYYKIVYKNKGTTVLSGNINLDFEGTFIDLVSAEPQQSNYSGNSLFWSFENLLPFESREIYVTFNLNAPTDTENPLNDGDNLAFTATINPIDNDETPDDNVFTFNQTVVNSYDPNDKTCLEGNSISPDMIGKYVHYMIRFENTGSAEAVNIVVKDIINTEMFDINTLIPLDGSHNFVTRIKNNNNVEFIFENIMLPFDDANNDGYVTFKIKTLDTLTVDDTLENNAEIYFDFNAPIITETAITNIMTFSTQGIDLINHNIEIYPNPMINNLHISANSIIKSVDIFNSEGKLVSQNSFIGNKDKVTVNVSGLSKGVYFIQIQADNSISQHKIIK